MTDLIFQTDVRERVRVAYEAIPTGAGRSMAARFYSAAELDSVPASAIDWALGVGNPVRHANLTPGETVLDVGSGAGIDTILAARRVGPAGHVTGVDLLAVMCERARSAAATAGVASWCAFENAPMEALPLTDASVDVVISNGALNLSPRKSRAIAEIFRVLRPGGRLCMCDLTVNDELPPEVLTSDAAWAGCISGALSERVFTKKLVRAGFEGVELSDHVPLSVDDVANYPLFTPAIVDLMHTVIPADQQRQVTVSLVVRATKPQS